MSFSRGHGLQLLRVCKHALKFNNSMGFSSHLRIMSSMPKQLLLTNINSLSCIQKYLSNFTAANEVPVTESMENISPTQMYEKTLDFSAITEGNEDLEKKLRILCLEHEVFRQEGILVPRSLNQDQWKHLLTLDSRSKRRKYYKFLFGIESKRDKEKLRKEQRAKERLERLEQSTVEEDDNKHIKYGLGNNSIFLRVYDTTINQLYNNNLINAMKFGQKIVIDCDYDNYMTPPETSNCAKQLMITFSENRLHKDPFDIHLCNAHKVNPTIKQLMKFIPNVYEDYFPLNIHSQSYLDIFPKQDIVYLTPHCRTELDKFDKEAVYVVGALVDKTNCEPLSLAKAKKEGLRMAKLPLDRYLQWSGGSGKSLTINQMIQILLEVRTSESWEKAFQFVPRRKLSSDEKYSSHPETFNRQRPFQPRDRDEGRPYWKKNYKFSR